MDSTPASPSAPQHRLGLILSLGVVLVAMAIGYLAWARGTFAGHEKLAILTWNKDPFWDPVEQGADAAAKDYNVNLTFIRSDPDEPSQTKHIRELLNDGVRGLAISPNNPKAQEAILNEAASKALVITFDSDAPNTKRRGFVGTNDYAAGQIAAEQVRAAIPDGGKVIISVGSVEMLNGRDRRQGLIDDLLDRPFKPEHTYDAIDASLKGKSYEVIATLTDGGDPAKASQLVANAINANPDVKCIVGLFSYSGPAIAKAVAASGKKGRIKIIGFDESVEEQSLVASGTVQASILQDQYRCGYETVRVLAELLRGVQQNGPSSPRLTELPVLILQPDNMASLRAEHVIRSVNAK